MAGWLEGIDMIPLPEHHRKVLDDCLDAFETDRIVKVMEHLDWKWSRLGDVPSQYDLRREARRLLRDAITRSYHKPEKEIFVGSGGIETTSLYHKDTDTIEVSVKFVIQTSEAWSKELNEA